MFTLLRLIRYKVLAYVALVMITMRYCCVKPAMELSGSALQLPLWLFVIYVMAICSLVAGAYIINDYFDHKADRISGIKKVLVGREISYRMAITLHAVFSCIAIVIVFFMAFFLRIWYVGFIFFVLSALLWSYSAFYKKVAPLANVVVALLAALLPFASFLFEIPLLKRDLAVSGVDYSTFCLGCIYLSVLKYSWMLFVNIFLYELTKDVFSIKGDKETGIRTIAVRYGEERARYVLKVVVTCVTLAIVISLIFLNGGFDLKSNYMLFTIVIPYCVYLLTLFYKPNDRKILLNCLRIILLFTILSAIFNILTF